MSAVYKSPRVFTLPLSPGLFCSWTQDNTLVSYHQLNSDGFHTMRIATTSLVTSLAAALTAVVGAQECEHVRFTNETRDIIAGVLFEDDTYNVNFECADRNYVVRVAWTMPLNNAMTESQRRRLRWDRSTQTMSSSQLNRAD